MTLPGIPADVHRALVAHLLEHSVRTGDFTLKSGRRSSWFIDSKQTACDPDGVLLEQLLGGSDLVIDALLGIGQRRPLDPEEPIAKAERGR